MNPLLQRFRALKPEIQQRLVMGGSALILIGLILVIAREVPDPKRLEPRKTVVRHLLTDADPRALGIDGLAADLRDLRKDQTETLQRLKDLETQPQRLPTPDPAGESGALQQEMIALKAEVEALRQKPPQPAPLDPPKPVDIFPPIPQGKPRKPFSPGSLEGLIPKEVSARNEGSSGNPSSIRVIRGPKENETQGHTITPSKTADGLYIPAGSLIAGYLLNGLDAPTGTHARKEPFPVLVRVKEEAILPNRYRADLRECFLIASGYGDLSAERAYIRAEIFSCIRQDGGVIEVPMDAYAVGEDGKLGLRGRIIDKQGQLMAESLAAGFAQGFSSLFSRIQVPVLMAGSQGNLSPNVPFQSAFSQPAAEGAMVQGTGAALNRLANYYMDMAENLFPVIEIDVTRRIEFVVQKGTMLRLGSWAENTEKGSPR